MHLEVAYLIPEHANLSPYHDTEVVSPPNASRNWSSLPLAVFLRLGRVGLMKHHARTTTSPYAAINIIITQTSRHPRETTSVFTVEAGHYCQAKLRSSNVRVPSADRS